MSIYVEWAKEVIKNYILNNADVENESIKNDGNMKKKSACFVSIHLKNGNLRGCIGTIVPYENCLYEEIRNNAISASTKDPRFYPVTENELKDLVINVDVLSDIKKVEDCGILNPKKHGIIVEKNGRRGLLLPDLEGVDTLEQQISIAKDKAGLHACPNDELNLSYFTVTRYL